MSKYLKKYSWFSVEVSYFTKKKHCYVLNFEDVINNI